MPPAEVEKTHKIFEQLELSDESDDDFKYEEIPDDPVLEEDEEETLDDFNRLLAETRPVADATAAEAATQPATVSQRPMIVDDFFRNFLLQHNLSKSLETFQQEWYDHQLKGELSPTEVAVVPDLYSRNQDLFEEINVLRRELDQARQVAHKAKHTWDKFRKERDFHRMHHRRVMQEKNKLIVDLKRLKKHYEQYEPTLAELRHKYEVAMKEKMLMRLERDRFFSKAESLSKQLAQAQLDTAGEPAGEEAPGAEGAGRRRPREVQWPAEDRANPYATATFEPAKVQDMKRLRTFKGHAGAVSRVAFNPKFPLVATVSDDHTWKMWSMPAGDLVLSGEGHKDWVSGIAFHPRGSLVCTTSGDTSVKLWDVAKEKCRHTFTDHSQAVWSCAFHDLGDFFVTCSMDQTTKAFDLQGYKCRQTFRGHVDSVNQVVFQPFSNNVLTASGDKTVSLWDLRSGLCVQTFYGHANACNSAVFNLKGDTIASCDSDGIVKLWDIKMVSEYLQIDTGQHPANSAAFDRSGKILAIASGDASIKTFDVEQKVFVTNLEGHEDSVQDVAFEPQNNKYMISASSDATFCLWQ
jgi:WD40 repeat protein